MKKDIGKRITSIRNNLRMKKNEFASFLGITPQYLGTVENGENCLSVEKIILLSQKANISTDYILLGKTSALDERDIKNLLSLTQEELDSYLNIIKHLANIIRKDC